MPQVAPNSHDLLQQLGAKLGGAHQGAYFCLIRSGNLVTVFQVRIKASQYFINGGG